jgi:hypothetical protein
MKMKNGAEVRDLDIKLIYEIGHCLYMLLHLEEWSAKHYTEN